MSTAGKLLEWEGTYLGYTEKPDNGTIFAMIAGHADHEAWCGTFQLAAMKSSRVAIPAGGDSPYTPTMFAAFKRAGLVHENPQVGDLGFVYYNSLKRIGHVFAVREVLGNNTVRTFEGNANQAESRTGGQVASLYRDWTARDGSAYVYGFARPAYDGKPVSLANLPAKADYTGQFILPAALIVHETTSTGLTVDGNLGPATIRALQVALMVSPSGAADASTVKALQAFLNRAAGARLIVDGGLGPKTIRAWQAYLGCPRDGVISHPHSTMVAELQRRLNAGTFRATSA